MQDIAVQTPIKVSTDAPLPRFHFVSDGIFVQSGGTALIDRYARLLDDTRY